MKIHKEVYGQGQPIVLIHGWAMHSGIWRQFAQQLAEKYQVTCLDLPGHGLSETIEPYTLEHISETLVEAIPDASFCVLGWSLGASVALTMAKNYPQRIHSLIFLAGNPRYVKNDQWAGMPAELLDTFSNNLSINSQLTLIRFLALQVNDLPEGKVILKQLKQALQAYDPPTEKVLQAALDILKYADLRNDLSALNCPISVIQGGKDHLIPAQVGVNMQKIQANCQLNMIPNAGHMPFLFHPAQVISVINAFL